MMKPLHCTLPPDVCVSRGPYCQKEALRILEEEEELAYAAHMGNGAQQGKAMGGPRAFWARLRPPG